MDFRFSSDDPAARITDALVVAVRASDDGPLWSNVARKVDAALDGELARLANRVKFSGKAASVLAVPTLGKTATGYLYLAGVGPDRPLAAESWARAVGAAVREARRSGAREISIALPDDDWGLDAQAAIEAAVTGAGLALYKFDHYRGKASEKDRDDNGVDAIDLHAAGLAEEQAQQAIARAEAIVRGVNLARDLGNEPASVLTPEHFAERAREVAESSNLEIEVLGPDELENLGAKAILAVGGGSSNGPRLVRLRYQPAEGSTSDRVVGLVGKAITFDTGGYSIKPYEGMLDMKGDMSGGAAVLGAMSALHALQCPLPVIATLCIAENMISGDAFRPGDVIKGMNGVTMEILSTDAEGRLVLADGLVDTARRGATEMIDLATLTGAAVVALGDGTTALFATDDTLANRLLDAAETAGERMWRMPLIDEFESKIEGDVADIKNTGGRAGGAITAALFLRHFSEELPWAHLDIAGAARQAKAGPLGPKGSSGVGVRTLLRYLTAT